MKFVATVMGLLFGLLLAIYCGIEIYQGHGKIPGIALLIGLAFGLALIGASVGALVSGRDNFED